MFLMPLTMFLAGIERLRAFKRKDGDDENN